MIKLGEENLHASGDALAAEVQKLRREAVAQARELAILRWEIAALLRQQPMRGRMTGFKYDLLRRFPKLMQRASMAKRRAWAHMRTLNSVIRLKIKRLSQIGLHGPVLLVDQSPVGVKLASQADPRDLISLSPGAGSTRSLTVAQAGEPPLRRPLEGSFIEWLVEDHRRLRRMSTIIVEAGDDVSLALLRGRLTGDQKLILTHSTGITSSLVADLGAPGSREAGASRYAHLPAAWLDPLDEQLRPNPAVASRDQWPKISVVMVSFNQAAFLEEGIRSILDQGYPNLEFIVVDGKSTDGSVDILEKYRARLSCLVIERDKGQSDGLNKGFARATGEILTWVNSDDLLEPGALFRVAQAFRGYDVDMVVGGCRQIGVTRDSVILNHHTQLPFGTPVALPLGLLLEMERFWLTGSFFYQPEVFFSRDIWLRSGGRLRTDLNYILDYDLWVRMAAAGATIVHIPDFLACSRTHDQQKTREGMPYMPEVQRLLQEYGSRLIEPSA